MTDGNSAEFPLDTQLIMSQIPVHPLTSSTGQPPGAAQSSRGPGSDVDMASASIRAPTPRPETPSGSGDCCIYLFMLWCLIF